MFELEVFLSKCTVLKKVVVTLLGVFDTTAVIRRHYSDSAPGELYPPGPPRYAPVCWAVLTR